MANTRGGGVTLGFLRYVLGFDSLAFEKGLDDAEKKLAAAQRNLNRMADSFKDVGKRLTTFVTVPVAGAAAAAIKMGGDFEASMNRVAISTQGTAAELKAMNDLALKLGKDTVFGATDAADAMDELAKNGLSARQVLDGAATAAVNLASAAGSELSPAAKAISDVMQQFKLGANELPGAVNQITGAVNQSKLDFADFAGAIAQAGGVAGSVGVSFTDFNAAIAATSALFASGSDAGTSFKTFLLALPGNSKPAIEAIKQYGLQFYDAQGKMRSMSEIAEQLRTKLGGLSDEAKTNVLKTIFGTDALRTAIGLMDQGAKGLDTVKAKIAETDAAAQSAQRLKGFNGQMEQLSGAIETLAIKIAQSGLLETITGVVTVVGNFIDRLSEVNPTILKFGTLIAGLAAVVGPTIIVLGSVVSGFSALLPILTPVIAAVGTLTSIIVSGVIPAIGGLLVTLSPILVPLAAIAAAVAGVYYAWKNWDTITEIAKRLYSGIKTWLVDKLDAIWNWVDGKIKWVKNAFFGLYDAVVGHSYIPDMVDEIGQHIARLQGNMVEPIADAAKAAEERIKALQSTVSSVLSRLFPDEAERSRVLEEMRAFDEALSKGAISKELWQEVQARLRDQLAQLEATIAEHRAGILVTPFGTSGPIDLTEVYANAQEGMKRFAVTAEETGDKVAESFANMANRALNSLSQFANAIKGGGFLDILSSAFNAFGAISGTGLFGNGLKKTFANFQPISGYRANGGPVQAGKSYVVGERRPELFTPSRSGYIHPSTDVERGGMSTVRVVPSPYFDVVVDGRAAAVAAPMAASAAQGGAAGAQKAVILRGSRSLNR